MKFKTTSISSIYSNRLLGLLLFFTINLFTSINAKAAEIPVSSIADLQNAINNSIAGDVIVLADGTYTDNGILINKSFITVKAATTGGVVLNGTNAITISGNNVTFSGFQFTGGFPLGTPNKIVITVSGNNAVLTGLNFSGYNASKYINLQGQYDEVSFCNFENKPMTSTANEKGNMIHIAQRSDLTPNYAKIRYCSFKNMPGSGGDYGNECIRITNHEIAEPNSYKSRTIVEYCYFTNTGSGDSEAISVKSDENILRYNTMLNNQSANFCFRYGDDNVAYGNFFINSGGIRIKESNNIHCYNNYFQNCGNGTVTAPVLFEYDRTSTVSHLNYLNFVNNTFVGGTPIQLGVYSTTNNGNVPITTFTNNAFANNIFYNTSANIFSESTSGITWLGNIRQGNLGITTPTSGIINSDPLLVVNSEGFYGLPSNSPAINASSSGYTSILDIQNIDDDPSLLLDISGQTRVGIKDIGCDEYATGATTNRPLGISDVGPSYLVTAEPTATSPQTVCVATNVANLVATGTDLKWYQTLTGGNSLITTTSLTPGNYYVSQTLNGNESARKTVAVITTAAPTASNSQTLYGATTIANLAASGTALKWYSVASGGVALATSTALVTGTTYYVSQTLNSCESSRTAVAVTILTPTQTITFTLPLKYTNSPDFDPLAVSSIGSAITYTSSNTAVATIVNNKIHIVANKGTSNITSSSLGATPVTQQLIVQCGCVLN